MNKLILNTSLAALLIACAGSASAGSQTSNLAVSASVAANCTITTSPVAFGVYDTVSGAAVNATGGVSIACTKGAATTVTLGLGANAAGSVRQMKDATTNVLGYELYQQPGTTPGAACTFSGTVWGTTGAGIFTPAAAPSKAVRAYNVCGVVTAGQDVPAGTYNDTVVATVNF